YSMDSTDNEILIHHGTIAGTLTNENGDGDGKVTTVSFRESVLWENSSGHKLLAMSPSGKEIYVVAQDSELNKEGFDPDGDDNDLMNVSFTLHRIRLSDSVDIKDRMKPVHHVEMNKQMKWVGTATAHSSGKMFAVLYTPKTDNPHKDIKEVVISWYNDD